tara:strand:+ start:53213 stop:53575 length:363 start_codon:yes stop_codon:yes gene_type:complete
MKHYIAYKEDNKRTEWREVGFIHTCRIGLYDVGFIEQPDHDGKIRIHCYELGTGSSITRLTACIGENTLTEAIQNAIMNVRMYSSTISDILARRAKKLGVRPSNKPKNISFIQLKMTGLL